jgi:hypothetical protein
MLIDNFRSLSNIELEKKVESLKLQESTKALEWINNRLVFITLEEKNQVNLILDDDTVKLIRNTIISEIPNAEPDFFKVPHVFKLNSNIFFNITELYFGKATDNKYFFVAKTTDNKCMTSLFEVNWPNGILNIGDFYNPDGKIMLEIPDEELDIKNWVNTLFFFLVTFCLLNNAENTPLKKRISQKKASKIQRQSGKKNKAKFYYTISFDYQSKNYGIVNVKGFIRNQACGKNWTERKLIYISPFERHQLLLKNN